MEANDSMGLFRNELPYCYPIAASTFAPWQSPILRPECPYKANVTASKANEP